MDRVSQLAAGLEEEVIRLRRDFHKHPELGLQEHRTGKIVTDYLAGLNIECRPCNITGVVGLLRGQKKGPTILLRADMDALPVQEETGLPYSSSQNGIMHACGHDAHTAMLLVAAKILSSMKDSLPGNIKFVFEPNEENVGALAMIEEGILKDPPVDSCLAVHVWNQLESGTIGVKPGPVMAGMKHFKLTVHGRGGHTAAPHHARDPILTAAAIIQGVQSIQTRETDALNEPLVIMFGAIAGGEADNVIPEKVTLRGTIRYLSAALEQSDNSPPEKFRRVIAGICAAHDTKFDLEFTFGHPTLVNDPALVEILHRQVPRVADGSLRLEPYGTLAGEDFSEFTSRVPGVFYFLGAGKNDQENFPHHHPRFDIDEKVLKIGVEIHVRAALDFLSMGSGAIQLKD